MKYLTLILLFACQHPQQVQTNCQHLEAALAKRDSTIAAQAAHTESMVDSMQLIIDSLQAQPAMQECLLKVIRANVADSYLIFLPSGWYSCGNFYVLDSVRGDYIYLCTAKK